MKREEIKDFITEVTISNLNFFGRLLAIAIPVTICYFEALFIINLQNMPKENIIAGILFTWLFINPVLLLIFPSIAIFPKTLKYIFTGDFSFYFNYYFNTGDTCYFAPYHIIEFCFYYMFGDWRKNHKKRAIVLDETDPDIRHGKAEVEKLLKKEQESIRIENHYFNIWRIKRYYQRGSILS